MFIFIIEKIGNQYVRLVDGNGNMYNNKGVKIGSAERMGDDIVVKDDSGTEISNADGDKLKI